MNQHPPRYLSRNARGLRSIVRCLGLATIAVLLPGCDFVRDLFRPRPPEVRFAGYEKPYAAKPDFARIDHTLPLSLAERAAITPDNLAALDQEQIDQIYARLTAGPIPDGPFDGKILLPRGSSGEFRFAEIAGGFTGSALHLKGLKIETLGESLWRGKVFFRDERVLRNRIEDLGILQRAGLVQGEPRRYAAGGKETWLLFPAKLYCGQSLLDARRESIIIDYFFSDDLPGYQELPDYLAGRRGLRIRDEVRMVRPGFYLGRAYADRIFLLNFTLYNETIAKRDAAAFEKSGMAQEDCYLGSQQTLAAQR